MRRQRHPTRRTNPSLWSYNRPVQLRQDRQKQYRTPMRRSPTPTSRWMLQTETRTKRPRLCRPRTYQWHCRESDKATTRYLPSSARYCRYDREIINDVVTDWLADRLVARIGRLASGAGRCRTTAPPLTFGPLPCRSKPRQPVAATFRSSDTG